MMLLFIVLGTIVLIGLLVKTARAAKRQPYKIHTAAGVQKSSFVAIGGIEQYIQVRGQDVDNPIIVMLHGGPGNTMAYYSYDWQADLEKDYTFVHWDQRGCGNTYYRNKEAEKPTVDLLLSDLDELVDYIRAEYCQDKVIVLGHSWGTFLGTAYAIRHPEKVLAYVGVGQFTDIWKSEQCGAEEAARLANAAGKTEDARKIAEQYRQVRSAPKLDLRELLNLRQLTGRYLPEGDNTPFSARLLSPFMTLGDFKWFFAPMLNFNTFVGNNEKLYDTLYSGNGMSVYNHTHYEVPVVIIAGDCDWITPYRLAQDYFGCISAPKKEFVLLEKAGHIPFIPGRFTEALANALSDILDM